MAEPTLIYKGGGDYDLHQDGLTLRFSYDGSDIAVGEWTFWGVEVFGQDFGGTQVLGPGTFTDWLEAHARSRKDGHLADEPEELPMPQNQAQQQGGSDA